MVISSSRAATQPHISIPHGRIGRKDMTGTLKPTPLTQSTCPGSWQVSRRVCAPSGMFVTKSISTFRKRIPALSGCSTLLKTWRRQSQAGGRMTRIRIIFTLSVRPPLKSASAFPGITPLMTTVLNSSPTLPMLRRLLIACTAKI